MARAYHGTHVGPLVDDYEELVWQVPVAWADRVRVRKHTCMCQAQSYELCTAGGLMFIRWTTVRSGKAVIHETERWLSKRAEETWLLLLAGQAR